ncbi:CBASS cGAMP-activated phospholipase [Cognatilysobacter terrigena]|uniref:CBASS cGAMP-activated phospholipase n=1 Tax=Cognatilysobacter terrigena TaxID=2488749 RepID=UPI001414E0EE|nr:CBASS cGAMP-activated phospholipase [Lysobacter terrigena]
MTESEPYFQALALTGGGFRGLYSAHVLQRLEERSGRPIAQSIDLIAGTSIGGIVALAAAFEVPMSKVVETFAEHGPAIFRKKRSLAGLASNLYDPAPLQQVIAQLIDRDAMLSDARHALVIPALNMTTGKQQILKTRHDPSWDRDHRYNAYQVALATAAAPIYFPLAEIDNQLFADGGLVANAPDLVALHEANRFMGQRDDRVRMLSVGTLSSRYSLPSDIQRGMGVWQWLKPLKFPLIETVLAAQQQFAIQLVQHRLGENYTRIDGEPSDTVMRTVGLDKADAAAQKALLGLAAKDVSDVLGTEAIQRFLFHTPRRWIVE